MSSVEKKLSGIQMSVFEENSVLLDSQAQL